MLPGRRRLAIWTGIALIIGASVAAATALAAASHYSKEHAAALDERREARGLIAENEKLSRLVVSQRSKIEQLSGRVRVQTERLDRKRIDIRFALAKLRRVTSVVANLRTKQATLQDNLASARAAAKGAYQSGYDDGYADGQNTVPVDSGGGCDPNYQGACVPTDIGDVDCGDLAETDFQVVGVDVDGLDGDGDGIACESY
jgi:hypothetical protein